MEYHNNMNEEQVKEVLVKLVLEHGEDCVDEVCHYGGLVELLMKDCDGSEESVKDCWGQACNNV